MKTQRDVRRPCRDVKPDDVTILQQQNHRMGAKRTRCRVVDCVRDFKPVSATSSIVVQLFILQLQFFENRALQVHAMRVLERYSNR